MTNSDVTNKFHGVCPLTHTNFNPLLYRLQTGGTLTKSLVKCPAFILPIRTAYAHCRWRNDCPRLKRPYVKLQTVLVIGSWFVPRLLKIKNISKTKKGHGILKIVKIKGRKKNRFHVLRPSWEDLNACTNFYRAMHSLTWMGVVMHVKLQTCASFQFNSPIIVVWVNCMNKLCLLTAIKVTFCYLYKCSVLFWRMKITWGFSLFLKLSASFSTTLPLCNSNSRK